MVTPTLAIYLQQFSSNAALIGAAIGIFTLASVVMRPFVGSALDRYGRRKLLMAGLAVFSLATLLYAPAAGLAAIFLIRVVHGLGFGIATTASSTVAADLAPESRRTEGLGYYGMATTVAQAFGPVIGLAIMESLGFAPLFVITAAITCLSLILAGSVGETFRPESDSISSNPFSLGRWIPGLIEPSALPPSLVVLSIATIFGGTVTFIPIYAMQEGFGNPGAFYTALSIGVVAVRAFAGQLADRRGSLTVLVPSLALVSVALFILGGAPHLFDTPIGPGGILLGGALIGMAAGAAIPTLLSVAINLAPSTKRGAANATFYMAYDLGIALGAFALGALANVVGYGGMYAWAGLLPLVTLGIVWAMRRRFA